MSELSPSKSNNETDFVRLPQNPGALINQNNDALSQYKKAKKRFAQLNNIEELTSRVDRIEELLLKVLEKLDDR